MLLYVLKIVHKNYEEAGSQPKFYLQQSSPLLNIYAILWDRLIGIDFITQYWCFARILHIKCWLLTENIRKRMCTLFPRLGIRSFKYCFFRGNEVLNLEDRVGRYFDLITSAKEVVFEIRTVCLSVCWFSCLSAFRPTGVLFWIRMNLVQNKTENKT